jgi:hypothetical protein
MALGYLAERISGTRCTLSAIWSSHVGLTK